MPLIKPISGHNGCENIGRYIMGSDPEKERTLALDLFNLEHDEQRPWWKVMDETRHAFGNDVGRRRNGVLRRPICYTHYAISPDPRDNCSLETLRDVACEWVERHFSDYEVAIGYHQDNQNRILHAHVVVNNTNLSTGRRFSTEFSKRDMYALNNDLQCIALAHGLSGFSADHKSMTDEEMSRHGKNVSTVGGRSRDWRDHRAGGPLARGAEASRADRLRPSTRPGARPARRRTLAQEGIEGRGEWSWRSELADLVRVARAISRNESEFLSALGALGVGVRDSSRGDDWVFGHPSGGAREARGARLGAPLSKSAIRRGFALGYADWAQRASRPGSGGPRSRLTREQRDLIMSSVAVVGCRRVGAWLSARDLSALLAYNDSHRIVGYSGYATDGQGREMRALAERLGLYDDGVERARRRLEGDLRTVEDWLDEMDEMGWGDARGGARSAEGPTGGAPRGEPGTARERAR